MFPRLGKSVASTTLANEYWTSRDLAGVLEYVQYRNFETVIAKAKEACFNSGQRLEDHFADASKMIEIGKGGMRTVSDMYLSRYACYLIVQFRTTQAEDKIRRENITGKDRANQAHREVGAKVRKAITEIGGTMPEDLPVPATSAKQLEKKTKKLAGGNANGRKDKQ